jgi:nitrous oxide reductase accessory protein NosL
MDFDRCSPSIIAFAKRSSAEKFASEHGGQVGVFLQIVGRPAVGSLP